MRDYKAHIGQSTEWRSYLASYDNSVHLLFDAVKRGEVSPDQIAVPLLFNMRQSLELGYKFCLSYLTTANGGVFDPQTHGLLSLHRELEEQFRKWTAKTTHPETERLADEFAVLGDAVKKLSKWFSTVDSESGTHFRFPTKLPKHGGGPVFDHDQEVDLEEALFLFKAALPVLHFMPDAISEPTWAVPTPTAHDFPTSTT